MGRCMKAQAARDVGTAIGNYVWGPYPEAAYEAFDLIELSQLGDDAPPWAYSRWIGRQSQRWLAAVADPRVRECAAEAFATTHEDFSVLDPPWLPPFDPDSFDDGEDEDEEDSLEWAWEVMSREFVANWLAFQLCAYELGGMRDFLEREASDALIEASDHPYEWADAKLGVYIYGWRQGDTLSVYDLQNKQERTVLHLGASSDVPECTIVLGRLVPITQEPGLMFESRPLVIDPETARGIVGLAKEYDADWLSELWKAVVAGRLPDGFASVGFTPLTSDLLRGPPLDVRAELNPSASLLDNLVDFPEDAERVRELLAAGLSEPVADGVRTCEIVLEGSDGRPQTIPSLAPLAAQYLINDEVYEALLVHCTDAEHERTWRLIADCVLAHLRPRCHVLASACAS